MEPIKKDSPGAPTTAENKPDLHLVKTDKPDEKAAGEPNLDLILDIPLKLSVELGRSKLLVQDLLKLNKGSVIELNKLAGDSLEVLVNDRVVAKGEVIVVNDKFGIRLTDIVNHSSRIRGLGDST